MAIRFPNGTVTEIGFFSLALITGCITGVVTSICRIFWKPEIRVTTTTTTTASKEDNSEEAAEADDSAENTAPITEEK